jgi:hypothetical protein
MLSYKYKDTMRSMKLQTSNQNRDSDYIDIKKLQLPANFFHDQIFKTLQSYSLDYTITAKVTLPRNISITFTGRSLHSKCG